MVDYLSNALWTEDEIKFRKELQAFCNKEIAPIADELDKGPFPRELGVISLHPPQLHLQGLNIMLYLEIVQFHVHIPEQFLPILSQLFSVWIEGVDFPQARLL